MLRLWLISNWNWHFAVSQPKQYFKKKETVKNQKWDRRVIYTVRRRKNGASQCYQTSHSLQLTHSSPLVISEEGNFQLLYGFYICGKEWFHRSCERLYGKISVKMSCKMVFLLSNHMHNIEWMNEHSWKTRRRSWRQLSKNSGTTEFARIMQFHRNKE